MTERCDVRARPCRDFEYPRVTAAPALRGTWPSGAEWFRVEELPLYPFCGEGEHAALVVEKNGRTTRDVAVGVARRLKVPNAAVGYAGMKDKDCVSVQSFTVTGVGRASAREAFEAEGCRVLEETRHRNKLRLGHLRGNRFRVFLRGTGAQEAEEVLRGLSGAGFPNYFGPQRFGSRGDNAAQGLAVLQGRLRTDRWKRDLLVSALQSFIFNEVLARRVEEGLLGRALDGDVLVKEDSGGLFVSEDLASDQPRVDRFEVSPTGPIPGKKMVSPRAESGQREEEVLVALGLSADLFSGETGTRRPLRARLGEWGVEPDSDGIWITFACEAGCYATALVRELIGASQRGG